MIPLGIREENVQLGISTAIKKNFLSSQHETIVTQSVQI